MDIDRANHNHEKKKVKLKTELCRRFREGVCPNGSKCNYAHGVAELRPRQPPRYTKHLLHSAPPDPEYKKMVHSASNASSTTIALPLHDAVTVKSNLFDKFQQRKIVGIYGDWI